MVKLVLLEDLWGWGIRGGLFVVLLLFPPKKLELFFTDSEEQEPFDDGFFEISLEELLLLLGWFSS